MWSSPSLIRIPFLFTTAIFYGHLVERTRRESQRADSAEALAAQLSRTLAEFKILYAKAQEAERIKTEFLATVSHELQDAAHLADRLRRAADRRQLRHRSAATSAARSGACAPPARILQQAIARMLDASRIDFGHETAALRRVRAQRAVRRAARRRRAERRRRRALAARRRRAAAAHRRREGAHHPAQPAGERLQVHRARHDHASPAAGIGRPTRSSCASATPASASRRPSSAAIFEAFQQGSNRGELAQAGVGLGLYIVQRLASRLGGEIRVESELGIGSTFTVRDPAPAAPRRRGRGRRADEPLPGRRERDSPRSPVSVLRRPGGRRPEEPRRWCARERGLPSRR